MAHTNHPHDPAGHSAEHPERHEHSDVPTRPLMMFMGVMLAVAVVLHVGLWFLFDRYEQAEKQRDTLRIRTAPELVRKPGQKYPPEPRIQGIPGDPPFHANTPRQDTLAMKQSNAARLSGLGADDQGRVRIPIETAMKIIAQKGFPATRPTTQGASHAH